MIIIGLDIKENPFYASYSDECWVQLAKEIMRGYANKYAYQIPTTALTQLEYDELDKKTYLPIRRSILNNIRRGPLRSVADLPSIYRALEEQRIAYKQSMGIQWKDTEYDNIFS